jgi:hypothetical protein
VSAPYCEDCKWFRLWRHPIAFLRRQCANQAALEGSQTSTEIACGNARSPGFTCGPTGKLFEAKAMRDPDGDSRSDPAETRT